MSETGGQNERIIPRAPWKGAAWLLFSGWTVAILCSLAWNLHLEEREAQEIARAQARAAISKDLDYREWCANQEGLYAVTSKPPHRAPIADYLPDARITTDSGLELTRIDPASMTRQVHELGERRCKVHSNLTSLQPTGFENAADEWEENALRTFAGGQAEASGLVTMHDDEHMRLMQPLHVQASCLQCHVAQGYRVGEVRGGISVAVPMTPIRALAATYGDVEFFHAGLWLIGVAAIWLGTRHFKRRTTERDEARAALAGSERRLRHILEASPIGIYLAEIDSNEQLKLVAVNPMAARQCTVAEEDLTGRLLEDVLPETNDADIVAHAREIAQHGGAWKTAGTRFGRGAAAPVFDVHVFQSAPGSAVLMFLDVTERAFLQNEVEHQRSFLASVLDSAAHGIIACDAGGQVNVVNRAIRERYGPIGGTVDDLQSFRKVCLREPGKAEPLPANRTPLSRVLHGEVVDGLELELVYPDAEVRTVLTHGRPVLDVQGKNLGAVISIQDITLRKQTEAELLHLNQKLAQKLELETKLAAEAERANQAKGAFLTNMSHEIRTPMAAILGYADVINDGCLGHCAFGAADHRDFVGNMITNGRQLLSLIDDVLLMSEIEAEGHWAADRKFPLPDTIGEVETLVRPLAEAKGLNFECSIEPGVPESVFGEPERIQQVLRRLLDNALKFTEQGRIGLSVRYVPMSSTTGLLGFDVSDSGRGISELESKHLFQPFVQGDVSTTRKFGGAGLGLAVCSKIVVALGGTLKLLKTATGEGSTFRLTLPVDFDFSDNEPAPEAEPPRRRSAPAKDAKDAVLSDCRVLLVEDGKDNQRIIGHILTKAGADVTIVENGRQAVETALGAQEGGAPFNVILMDMQMPIMDGYDASRSLRNASYALPIIALTAHTLTPDRQKCLEAGCDDYLQKPVKRDVLVATVQKWSTAAITA